MKKIPPFIIGLIIICVVLWPLFVAPYFSHQDDLQTIRIYEMNQCFKDGQFPCRWVPDVGGEYGYPLFNYYAPLPYYIGEIFFVFSGSLLFAAKAIFLIPFVGSFIFMYFFARAVWNSWGGMISGVLYGLAPYHALDFYVRGAMGELWGLLFYPFVGWAVVRLWQKPSLGRSLLLGLALALLITSHNLSTMLLAPWLLGFILLLWYLSKAKEFLIFSLAGILIGVLLAAFYLLPVIYEKDLVHVDTTIVGYFSYTEHFKGLRKVLFDPNWYYGQSIREVPGSEKDGLSYQIGWVHEGIFLLAIIAAYFGFKKQRKLLSLSYFSIAVVGLSIFMIHPRSEFVWHLIPPFKYLQFPWRFLGIAIFSLSFFCGSLGLTLNQLQKKLKPLSLPAILITISLITLLYNFQFFRPEKLLYITDQDLFKEPKKTALLMRANFDFLPIFAEAPPAQPAATRYEILTGNATVQNFKEGSNWFSMTVDTKDHTIMRFSQFYFPDWEMTLDGAPVKIDYKNPLALMTVIFGEGHHIIDARLYDTPVRTFGNTLSLLMLAFFIVLSLLTNRTTKKQIMYCLKGFNR
jgi:hypothetical protein